MRFIVVQLISGFARSGASCVCGVPNNSDWKSVRATNRAHEFTQRLSSSKASRTEVLELIVGSLKPNSLNSKQGRAAVYMHFASP